MVQNRDISCLFVFFSWVGLGEGWRLAGGVIVLVGCVNFIIPLKDHVRAREHFLTTFEI